MKIVILLVALLATTVVFGQCPFPSEYCHVFLYLQMRDSYLLQCKQNFIDNITPSNISSRGKEGYKRIVAIAKDYFSRGEYKEFTGFFMEGQYLISLWTAHMLIEYGSPDKDLKGIAIDVIKRHTENPLAPEVAEEESQWIKSYMETS